MADRAYGNSLMDWLSKETGMDYRPNNLPFSVSPTPAGPNPMNSEAPPSKKQPEFHDPQWDAFTGWLGRVFTREGAIRDSAQRAQEEYDTKMNEGFGIRPMPTDNFGSAVSGYGSGPAAAGAAVGAAVGRPSEIPPSSPASPAPPVQPQPSDAPPSAMPMPIMPENAAGGGGLPGLEETIAAFKQLLPDRTYDDSRQAAADAETAKMQSRNALLAQLAFAGGVVSGAGKQWEGIGKGFLSAAATYDEGFQRYQQALQDGADRATRKEDRDYELGISRNKAAFDYYNAARQDARANAKEGREVLKERMDLIDKYFTSIIDAHKDDIDGQAADVWGDAWRKSRAAGEIILPSENVADEETN